MNQVEFEKKLSQLLSEYTGYSIEEIVSADIRLRVVQEIDWLSVNMQVVVKEKSEE